MKKFLLSIFVLLGFVTIFAVSAQAQTSPFTVTFPSAGSTLLKGQSYNLTWTGSDQGVTSYSVYLVGGSLGSTGSRYLGTAYTSQGSFNWTVPTDIAVGSGYQIQFSGAGASGNNSASFAIAAPPFTVTFPSSGATLQKGSTYNLTWTGSDPGVTSYSVYLVGGSLGSTGSRYLGTAYTSQSSFSWTVPSDISTGSGYQIQFSGAGASGNNSGSFTISGQPFTVTYPSTGANLTQGQTYSITWTGSDSGVTSYSVYLVGGSLGSTGSRYLGTAYTSQGSFNWIVPTDLSGSGYQIQFSGAGASGNNSGSFTIITTTQPFTVTYPSAGATLNLGSTYNLTWSGADAGVDSYAVYLVGGSLGSTGSKFLGTAYSSQKTFSWTLPNDVIPGSGYQIQFSGAKATGNNSQSFTIANPYPFNVTYPSAGATLNQGATYKITWSGRDPGVTSYSVYLVGGNLGSTGSRYLGTVNTATQDWFSWTVPSDVSIGSGYQIQFSGAGATGDNSASFSVVGPTNPYPFKLISPSAGATLVQGTTYKILWSGWDYYNGNHVTNYTVYLVGGSLGSTGSRYLGMVNLNSQDWFSWTVPSDITPASGYQIQFSGIGASGDNSGSFTIVASQTPAQTTTTTPTPAQTTTQTSTTATNNKTLPADVDTQNGSTGCLDLQNNLRYRMRDIASSDDINSLQDYLQSGGYLNSEPTGFFGVLTLKAVKDFQQANGISPTGFVGAFTRAKIKALTCGQ